VCNYTKVPPEHVIRVSRRIGLTVCQAPAAPTPADRRSVGGRPVHGRTGPCCDATAPHCLASW